MNDKQIAALIMSTLKPQMVAQPGLESCVLARNFPARQQGREVLPAVYFVKIADPRHGSPLRSDVWDETAGAMVHEERQLIEATYQFSALVPQDPAATAALTESDVLNVVSAIMQSDAVISAFRAADVGIQRVTSVNNPYFLDDVDRFEASPSFDIVLTYYRILRTSVPAVSAYDAQINRV